MRRRLLGKRGPKPGSLCGATGARGATERQVPRLRRSVGSEGTSDASRVRVLAGPGFSRCNAWAGAEHSGPGPRRVVSGDVNLWHGCTYGVSVLSSAGQKKRIGTAPGFSPEPTLGLSSLARVSSTLQLGGHPVVERFERHRSFRSGLDALALRLRRWNLAAPPAPSGFAGTPLRSPFAFGFPAPACAFAFNPPARVAERSAPSFRHGRFLGLRLRTDHFAARRRGDSFCLCLRRPGALGVLRRSTGRVLRRSPRSVCR